MYRTILILILISHTVAAQTDTSGNSKISVTGFIDAYFAYDFNEPSSKNRGMMQNGQTHIYSHNRHNEFAINQALIRVGYSGAKARGKFSLQTGTYPQANYSKEPAIFRNIYEAYAGYSITDKLAVDAGIFTSHIGFESAVSMDNLTLTRSIMADNTPYYESGIKVSYEASKKISLQGLILNGWQNIVENNNNKALGTQIQYKGGEKLLVNSSTFIGKETPSYDSISTMRYFHNFYTKIVLSKLSVIVAFDVGCQQKRIGHGAYVWYNPNIILSYQVFSKMRIAARMEYYHDKNGIMIYTGTSSGFQNFAPSVNVDFKLYDELLWRIEGRMFNSKDAIYQKSTAISSRDLFLISSLAIKF